MKNTILVLSLFAVSFSVSANKAKLGQNIKGQLKSDSIAKTGQVIINEHEETQKLLKNIAYS